MDLLSLNRIGIFSSRNEEFRAATLLSPKDLLHTSNFWRGKGSFAFASGESALHPNTTYQSEPVAGDGACGNPDAFGVWGILAKRGSGA